MIPLASQRDSARWLLLPLVLGVVLFFLVTGGKILNPGYTDWLMNGDPAQHLLGWQFFRFTPLLQWPLGANPNFGMALSSSIVFTDSIPLMAFIFKVLNPLLPEQFQYMGLWALVCFALQSLFAWKLLGLYTRNKFLLTVGCVFFAIAPAAVWRLHGHFALFGQWTLVASLYLYCSKDYKRGQWVLLLSVGVLIHAYLVAMLLAIAITDLVQRIWIKQMTLLKAMAHAGAALLLVALIMWAVGYFMVGAGVASGGFGFYRMNLLSLIDADDIWSRTLPDIQGFSGDYEGFNFLGSGMLVLAAVAIYVGIKNRKTCFNAATALPLAVLSVGLFAYAISNHIAWGAHEFAYSLPAFTTRLTDTFRASGRFFWPAYYALYLLIFYILFTQLKNSVAISLCAALLAFQIFDSQLAWKYFNNKFDYSAVWSSPMSSPSWNDLAKRYKTIMVVLPRNSSENWIPIPQFAAAHHMSTNSGYFARVDSKKEDLMREQLTDVVKNNTYDPATLYVFKDEALWKLASETIKETNVLGVLDGFRILAPDLKNCTSCDTSDIESIAQLNDPPYSSDLFSFVSEGNGVASPMTGWSPPTALGMWSQAKTATVRLDSLTLPKRNLELKITATPFLSDQHPRQLVEVLINGVPLGTVQYTFGTTQKTQSVKIPKRLNLDPSHPLLITFNFKDAITPSELGMARDDRPLGLNMESLQFTSGSLQGTQ